MNRWFVERDGRRVEVAVERRGGQFEVTLDRRTQVVQLVPVGPGLAALSCADLRTFSVGYQEVAPSCFRIALGEREFEVRLRDPLEREVASRGAGTGGPQQVRAPIPGKVVSVTVEPGHEVSRGQPLLVLEAMKMENQICAEGAGRVVEVLVQAGATVERGQLLVVVT